VIHIDLTGKQPPAEWLKRATAARKHVCELTDPEKRARYIDGHSIWSETVLKDWLCELSHGKCWYSEAQEIYSFYDVDHFRPKNRARQLDGTARGGYWWLAFEWTNYRLSGGIGNRPNTGKTGGVRGKADYFPIRNTANAATGPASDLRDELAYLLDPTDPDDVALLTFDETGQPGAMDAPGSWTAQRVCVTINKLHLDYRPLVEARKKVWLKCRKLIDEGEEIKAKLTTEPGPTRAEQFKEVSRIVREMTAPEAELSATARECVLKSNVPWAIRAIHR